MANVIDDQILRHESGSVECKLCLTLHPNETSFLAHAQGKRHQTNQQKLATKSKPETNSQSIKGASQTTRKVGIPRYQIQKIKDSETNKMGFQIELSIPKFNSPIPPMYRIMSTYEQTIEPINSDYQYLVLVAEPYENVAFKIPSKPIDEDKSWDFYNKTKNSYNLQLMFK